MLKKLLILLLTAFLPIAEAQQNPPQQQLIWPPQGRLTLQSGFPVQNNGNLVNLATIYYDAYVGNKVPIYSGVWTYMKITNNEISTVLDATHMPGGTVYDVYAFNNNGVLALCVPLKWTTNASRGTGVGTAEIWNTLGIYTNKQILTNCWNNNVNYGPIAVNRGTYLGTFETSAAGTTWNRMKPPVAAGGSLPGAAVWNAYNRVKSWIRTIDSNVTWTYQNNTWIMLDNAAGNTFYWVDGLGYTMLECRSFQAGSIDVTNGPGLIGVGVNGISTNPEVAGATYNNATGMAPMPSFTTQLPLLGLNYCRAVQTGTNAVTIITFNGVMAAPVRNANGVSGIIEQ